MNLQALRKYMFFLNQRHQISLAQLSKELSSKEIEIKKMEKQNLIGTIVSIIGIILTVIFGILSLR